jgi:hypothetical protein
MTKTGFAAGAAALLVCTLASQAMASVRGGGGSLPSAATGVNWNDVQVLSGPGSASFLFDIDGVPGGHADGFVSGTLQSLYAGISYSGFIPSWLAGDQFGQIVASVEYYVQVDGPPGPVLVDVAASGGQSAYSCVNISAVNPCIPGVQAYFGLYDSQGNAVTQLFAQNYAVTQVAGSSLTSGEAFFNVDQPLLLDTGSVYAVIMDAAADLYYPDSATWARVDPYFAIDPSVADASLYSFAYSPGVTPLSAPPSVPEPAGWALMLVGIGGIGPALLGFRRSATAPA